MNMIFVACGCNHAMHGLLASEGGSVRLPVVAQCLHIWVLTGVKEWSLGNGFSNNEVGPLSPDSTKHPCSHVDTA